jgi:colicin import membrane protein
MNNELVKLTDQIPLEKPKAQVVMEQFNQFFDQVSEYETRAKAIEITDISQTQEMKEARDIRLKLKDIRVNAEKVKKRLKENIIVEDRFICGCYNIIEGLIKPIENDLLEKEKFVERIEQERLEKIRVERFNQLAECEVDGTFFDLVNMPEEAFKILLETSRLNYKNRIEAEKQAEAERIAREKAEIEEREKIKAENERLKKEAETRELEIKKEKERLEKENAERLAKEEAERKAIEAERKKFEAERLRIENEQKAKEESERKAKLEAEEKQRQASLAPDKNKLLAFASNVDTIPLPELSSIEANKVLSNAKEQLIRVSNYIRENAQKI